MREDNLFALRANLGVIFRGPLDGLNRVADHLEDYCEANGITIAYKKASASRLFIKEDGEHGRDGDSQHGDEPGNG